MIRLTTFSTLYPNRVRPHHGVFVEHRLRHLLGSGEVRSTVVAPVPWFPFEGERFGRYAEFARVPTEETRHGVRILHPRYPLIPKVGMSITPILLAMATMPTLRRLMNEGSDFDVIDAHYFFPDGVAATMLGAWLGKPVVITARGTDINLIPEYECPRRQILWAARRCSAMITVCQALKDRLVELGARSDRVTVLRNGVDLQLFRPGDPAEARRRLGLRERTLLSVGLLTERKGHDIVISALPNLPGVNLVIIGDGEAAIKKRLEELVSSLDLRDRVQFVDPVGQEELRQYYVAAEALVLASSREGMANVLLESLACGTPVIAAPSWGTPEVVSDPAAGILMERRDGDALAAAYLALRNRYPDQGATRIFAERFDWKPTTQGQLEIFSSA